MKQNGLAPILIVLLIALAVGGYFLYQKQSKPILQPVTQSSPVPIASSSAETADWKIYTSPTLGFSFKYPTTWYLDDESMAQSSFIRIQNYPRQSFGRGYSQELDKGKVFIIIMKRSIGSTMSELKENLIKEDEQSTANLGPRTVSNEKEIIINGNPGYYREVSVGNTSPTPIMYILDGNGNVVQFSIGLDEESGINVFKLVSTTFKFTQ